MTGSFSVRGHVRVTGASGPDRFNNTLAPEESFSTVTTVLEVESDMCLPAE
ncbi:MAG: hypothetical protein JRH00_08900 [Deltaproteobacteria bacterium]|nr:hypothetical protein [Deltaproteobacteria bacterium]